MLSGKIVTIFYHSVFCDHPPKTSRCINAVEIDNLLTKFVVSGKIITIGGKAEEGPEPPKNRVSKAFLGGVNGSLTIPCSGRFGRFFFESLLAYLELDNSELSKSEIQQKVLQKNLPY